MARPPPSASAVRAGGRRVNVKRTSAAKKELQKAHKKDDKERLKRDAKRAKQAKPSSGGGHHQALKALGLGLLAAALFSATALWLGRRYADRLPTPQQAGEAVAGALVRFGPPLCAAAAAAAAAVWGARRAWRAAQGWRARQEEERLRGEYVAERARARAERHRARTERRARREQEALASGNVYEPSSDSSSGEEDGDEASFQRFLAVPTGSAMTKEEARRLESEKKNAWKATIAAATATYAGGPESDDEDGGEGESDGDGGGALEAERELLEIAVPPVRRGTEVVVEKPMFWNIGVMQPASLALQLACDRCGHNQPMALGALYVGDNRKRVRCQKCSTILEVALRPCFIHEASLALAYFDVSACSIVDAMHIILRASCLACSEAYTLPPLKRGARVEAACHDCFHKLAFQAGNLGIREIGSGGAGTPSGRASSAASGAKRRGRQGSSSAGGGKRGPQQRIVAGQPLPDKGACEHFKKSLRWLRFTCCGQAFPCPVCHEKSDCAAADMGVMAARMICGACSEEQNFANTPCRACGFAMGRGRSAQFWQGGAGARSQAALSKKDGRKHKGVARDGKTRKTQSKKAQRVGAAGKKARQQAAQ